MVLVFNPEEKISLSLSLSLSLSIYIYIYQKKSLRSHMQSSPVQGSSRAHWERRRKTDRNRAHVHFHKREESFIAIFAATNATTGHRHFHPVSRHDWHPEPGHLSQGFTLTRSQASFLVRPEKEIQIIAGLLQSLKQQGK